MPNDHAALLETAQSLRRSGDWAGAARAYQQVLAISPSLPDSWYNLGLCLTRLGRFDDALAAYGQALQRGVRAPEEAHLNRGVIFADHLNRPDDAQAEYRAALALNEHYLPALINLGNLAEDRGDRAEASQAYARAREIDPHDLEALVRFANLAPAATPDASLIAELRAGLVRARGHAAAEASLGFALGRSLEAAGDYDAAFAAYARANAASAQSAAKAFDSAAHTAYVDAIIEAFPSPELMRPTPNAPIFICGMFRSGSTLLEQVLAAHSEITAGGELNIIPGLAHGALAPYPDGAARLTQVRALELMNAYCERLARLHPNARRLTDKRPDNFLYVGLIKRLFPDARIIHTTRNAFDNCLSVFFLHLDQGMNYAFDLENIGHFYAEQQRLMTHWKSLYPEDIYTFDYDAFVAAPRNSLAPLLDWLGLEWEDACLSFHSLRNVVKTASVWQVREPLYQRASGRWRNYEKHLDPLRRTLEANDL